MLLQAVRPQDPQPSFDLGQQVQNDIGFPQSLDERYQPRTLADFIGLERPKQLIQNLIRKPRPCNLIFVGPPGAGKSVMAMALAELLPGSLHHVSAQKCDVATLDALNDKFAYCPPIGKFWICLVDEADQMTEKAQLQLLSRLDGTASLKPVYGGGFVRGEAPPIIWIFTCNGRGSAQTEVPYSFAQRFKSRNMIIEFPAVSQDELAKYLEKIWNREGGPSCTPEYFHYMADGVGVRDALKRLESDLLAGPRVVPVVQDVQVEKPKPLVIAVSLQDKYSNAARKAWETRRARMSAQRHH
jgi:hypothetical protein